MKRLLLTVRNEDQLLHEAGLRPLLEWIAPAIAPGRGVREIRGVARAESGEREGWLCLVGGEGEGIAVCPASFELSSTPLQAALSRAHVVRRVSERLSALGAHGLVFDPSARPPREWREFVLEVEGGSCALACGGDISKLRLQTPNSSSAERRVKVRVVADRLLESDLERVLQEIPVCLPELGKRGALVASSQGGVIMRIDGDDDGSPQSQSQVRVRLELGEMELGLRELLSLRPGSAIELGTSVPMPCALVVGASTMARGAVEFVDDGLRVRVVEIVE